MPPRFAIVPARAVEDEQLKRHPAALRVLLALGTFTDATGWCCPSQKTLARQLKITRQAAAEHIQLLVRLGYVEVKPLFTPGGSRYYSYRIIPDDAGEPTAATAPTAIRLAADLPALPAASGPAPRQDQFEVAAASRTTPAASGPAPRQDQFEVAAASRATPAASGPAPRQAPSGPSSRPAGGQPARPARSELAQTNKTDSTGDYFPKKSLESEESADGSASRPPGERRTRPGTAPGAPPPPTAAGTARPPELLLYRRITGMLPRADQASVVIAAVRQLHQFYPDEQALAAYLDPLWERWKTSKRRDGTPYSRFNPAWLTEWAVERLAAEQDPSAGSAEPDFAGVRVISNPSQVLQERALIPTPDRSTV